MSWEGGCQKSLRNRLQEESSVQNKGARPQGLQGPAWPPLLPSLVLRIFPPLLFFGFTLSLLRTPLSVTDQQTPSLD